MFQSLEHEANALFIGAKGAFDIGDFLVNHTFQFARALNGMFNAANELIHFSAHQLRDGGKALGCNVLRGAQGAWLYASAPG